MSAADLEISQALGAIRRPPALTGAAKTAAEADKAAKEFEAIFIGQMVSAMFEGIKTDGPFGGGYGESVYRSMMIEHYSKTIAAQGGLGLADQVKREILRLQEMNE
jgi:Rod binding domain-containing protein